MSHITYSGSSFLVIHLLSLFVCLNVVLIKKKREVFLYHCDISVIYVCIALGFARKYAMHSTGSSDDAHKLC